jgi:hypothetical protein
MDTIEILKNQLAIMKALLILIPDGDAKTALQGRIIFTEGRIKAMY